MGVAFTKIIPSKVISLDELQGKILAVDGYNILYQFLTTIRGPDGSPLTSSNGDVTSHLTGLFSRTTNLLARGIKLIFVFDGKVPDLKWKEVERRRALKDEAHQKFEAAKAEDNIDDMKKFAGRTSKLTREMVAQAKELLDALGVPWMDAPSEGEAQAAALVKQGHAWAVVSQDADALLYESPRIIKNLAISGKRKLPGRSAYVNVEPELIEHKDVLAALGVTNEQLRNLAILVGTDYNIGGVKGIGPRKGLKLAQEFANPEELQKQVNWDCENSLKEILHVFQTMPIVEAEKFEFKNLDRRKVEQLLVEKFEFGPERVRNSLDKVEKSAKLQQRGLHEFF